MREVLRVNWDFILYEEKGYLILFVVNGHSGLDCVTYSLTKKEAAAFKRKGSSVLMEKVEIIRQGLKTIPQLDFLP